MVGQLGRMSAIPGVYHLNPSQHLGNVSADR